LTLPVETLKSVPRGKAVWNANGGFVSVLLTHLLPAIRSSERRARYLFYCMFVCLFVCSVNDFSTTRGPIHRFTPKFACGRTLVPDVSSSLLEVGGSRRAEKGQMKFSLLWELMGNFCILAVFERYLSNACTDPHQILFVYAQCRPTCPLPLWCPSAPGGRGEGELKTQKMGGGLIRA